MEAGGTKMVCSIGDEAGQVFERVSYPTTTPDETMPKIIAFFKERGIERLGIGSFGPVDLHKESPTFGNITSTPKLAWKNYPLYKTLEEELKVPAAIDTDVNAAAWAEYQLGAGKGLHSLVYVTVGTGIGGGVVVNDAMLHGLVHPEIGHMLLRPDKRDPLPEGICPYHKGCLEGLAAGPSILKRFGIPAQDLPKSHPAWELEAEYLAQMCMNLILTLSPEIIVLGGGVMQQMHLFPMVRERTLELLNSYVADERVLKHMDEYIVSPGLDIHSGVIGALLLGAQA